MRIAILMHQNARKLPLSRYAITHLARFWINDGNKVFVVFGDRDLVPADIAILHVDLSIVPDSYLELATHYPVVLNGKVRDIRKSTISKNLLVRDAIYSGKVIVKSDLNFAGMPERVVLTTPSSPPTVDFKLPQDYRVYDSLAQVPERYFDDPRVVVEKFLPEMEDDWYCVRNYLFLGDQTTCYRAVSRNPVVSGNCWERVEIVEPHPELLEWRQQLNFDYGKFDYVVHNGRPVLLDTNKTVGAPPPFPGLEEIWRNRAKGIYAYTS